jgi:hypothetical protein
MTKLQYSMRVAKLKRHTLTKAHNHNSRIIVAHEKHVDHGLTKDNQSLIETNGKTLNELVNERIEKLNIKSVRKDAVVAMEMVVSATPDYFRPDDPDRKKYYHKDKMEAWRDAVMDSLKAEFGDNLISAELHLDESTPHIHCCITPIEEKQKKKRQSKQQKARGEEPEFYNSHGFNARKMFNPEYLLHLQEHLPKAVNHLGIERGLKGSKAKHRKSNEYREILARANEEFKSIEPPLFGKFKDRIKATIGKVNVLNYKQKMDTIIELAYEALVNKYFKPKVQKMNKAIKALSVTAAAAHIEIEQLKQKTEFYDAMVSPYANNPEEFIESFSYQIQQNKALNDKNVRLVEANDNIQKQANEALIESSSDYQSLNQELMQTKNDHEEALGSLVNGHEAKVNEHKQEVKVLKFEINKLKGSPIDYD